MKRRLTTICFAAVAAFIASGCGTTATTTVAENRTDPVTPIGNSSPTPAPTPAEVVTAIETREPDSYRATLELKAETVGGQQMATPKLSADVTKQGEKRRVEFILPNNERVIYMNLGQARYLVLPGRRQYAELDAGSVGFQLPRLMMPDQIIDHLKGRKDFQRVGEETFRGQPVIKYRSAGTTQTGTKAGEVVAESFTYVDKETGLPLRAEFHSQAGGNVQGVKGVNAVVEMHNVKTDVAADLFEVPKDYAKITSEQVRNQINAIGQIATAIVGNVMTELNQPSAASDPQTKASPR